MRISWRNLFWKLLTFLISEIDAFSLKDISYTTSIASDNNIEQLYPNRTSDFYIAFLMELTDKMGKV